MPAWKKVISRVREWFGIGPTPPLQPVRIEEDWQEKMLRRQVERVWYDCRPGKPSVIDDSWTDNC